MAKQQNQSNLVKINNKRHMVIAPKARLSFPTLFTAKSFQDDPDQKKYFSADLIFDSQDDFKKDYAGKKVQTVSMSKAVAAAKMDQWGPKEKWPKFTFKTFRTGNENIQKKTGEVYNGYADKFYITAKSGEKFPPKLVDRFGKPIGEKEMYAGCYVQAQLIARPVNYGKNIGVRFLLLQLMKVDDGERFGGTPDDVFDVAEVDEESFDGGADADAADDSDDF